MFIGLYVDYNKNELMYSNKTHTDLESVKYDLNYTINSIIHDKFNISLTDEYVFINNPLNVKINIIQTLYIHDTELIFIKNGLTIDVYSKKTKKGYLYNDIKEEHIYKFCIINANKNESNENIPIFNNPSSLINVFGKCKKNEANFTESDNDNESYNDNQSYNKSYSESDIEEEIPFSHQTTDLFLQELKEKLKNRLKIKQD